MAENTGLFKKLVEIRKTVGKVEKDGTNKHQSYKYQSIEAINTAIRSAMNDVGVWLFSECPTVEPKDGQWVCNYVFTFVDEDTGQSQSLAWSQAAPMNDKNDKMVGIIHSYAQKYFLIRTFLVTTQEDIDLDLDSSDGGQGEQRQAPQREDTQGKQEWVDSVKNLTHVLYIGSDGKFNEFHQKGSLNKASDNGLIDTSMSPEKAAVTMLMHRIETDYGYKPDHVQQIIGGRVSDFMKTDTDPIVNIWHQVQNHWQAQEQQEAS